MNTSIPLGQFINTNSAVHRLDPRTKILTLIGYLVALLCLRTFVGLGIAFAFFAVAMCASHIGWRSVLRSLKVIMVVLVITVLLNMFLTPGNSAFSFGPINVSYEGIKLSIRLVIRLFLIVAASSLLTFTTTPTMLTDGLTSILSPLAFIKVPVQLFSMMMSIALRFIPTLFIETSTIIKAQKSRGAEFESRNPIVKLKAYALILVPLLVNSFARADDLANAMEARGFDGKQPRTHMKKLRFKTEDAIALGVFILMCILLVIFDTGLCFDWSESLSF